MREALLLRGSVVLGVGLIYFALFGKDVAAEFWFGFEKRNTYGAAFLVVGCLLCFLHIVLDRRLLNFFGAVFSPLIMSWVVLLFVVAPATSYYYRGSLYISPQAVGLVAAVACFQASPLISRRTLIATLCVQFVLLLYEFRIGLTLTPSLNEALGYELSAWGWIIDTKANLVRAKGLFDSTHDSTWLFIYSTFVFPGSVLLLLVTAIAAWFSLARLGIIVAASLALADKSRVTIVLLILSIVGVALFFSPKKISSGAVFFVDAFDPQSRSNIARIQATKESYKYLIDRLGMKAFNNATSASSLNNDQRRSEAAVADPALKREEQKPTGQPKDDSRSVVRTIFGVSGLALVSGEVATESSYTLFLIEYGIIGLALMAWTIALVFFEGRQTKKTNNLTFTIMMAVIMASSSVQSASSFFMFWIAVFHLVPQRSWSGLSFSLFHSTRSKCSVNTRRR